MAKALDRMLLLLALGSWFLAATACRSSTSQSSEKSGTDGTGSASAPRSDRPSTKSEKSTTTPTTVVAVPVTSPPLSASVKKPAFAGSASCAECHQEERDRWQKGWHAKALAKAGPKSVVGRFGGVRFAGSSSEAVMRKDARRGFVMRTRGQGAQAEDFPVSWVVGGRHMQDNLTEFPDGRWQILPVYFHVTSRQWVDYTETKQGPLDPAHPYYWTNVRRLVQHECLDCHVTGMEVAYDDAAERWTTEFADAGVGCESCHGPGAKHAQTSAVGDIFQPRAATAERGMAVCAQCHGPRVPLFPLFDTGHRYQPGDRYEDFYDPIVVTIGGKMSEDFFPDGRPRTSSFEYQGLLQSACYLKGGATCLTCHVPPHAAEHASELASADPDASCKGCHEEVAKAGAAHTHHRDPRATRCVACHMPKVLSGVLDAFADHAIDVPSLTNTAKHKIPNGCTLCHGDQPVPALAAAAAKWWPALGAREARRVRLADAFDEATAPQSARPLTAVVMDEAEAPTLRGAALMVLAMRFGASAAPAIAPSLEAKDPLLRAKAAEALGGARVKSAADALAGRLGDSSLRVRLAAAMALAAIADPRAEAAMRALADDPTTSDLLPPRMWLGGHLARRGDLAAARRYLGGAVQLSPYNTEALWHLAEVVARQGDLALARRLITRALALEPAYQPALDLLRRLQESEPH
jgi:HEAT repeats/Cytochrome c554 and c-prime/Doubled CXXCH motif (Paired_CXXCH_1)